MRRKVTRSLADIDLHQAAMNGDLEAARRAMREGADVNSQEEEHYITPLIWACGLGESLKMVQLLVEAGADINYQDENLASPLLDAVSRDRVEVVRFLVERGADVTVRDGCGLTPLGGTVAYGMPNNPNKRRIADLLIAAGADINAPDAASGLTPLMVAVESAAESGQTAMVIYLLERGADPTAVDDNGDSVSDHAYGDHAGAVEALLMA